MILVDTSLWLRFFRGEEAGLSVKSWVLSATALVHPFVRGELLLGGLSPRNEGLLDSLTQCQAASAADVFALIRGEGLAGEGIGWVDASLLATALGLPALVATLDQNLGECAKRLGVSQGPGAS